MSWQPQANRQDILYQSAEFGWNENFFNRLPNTHNTSTSGGGTAGTGNEGLKLSAGTTAGDSAALLGVRYDYGTFDLRPFQGTLVGEYLFASESSAPFTDATKIGMVNSPDLTGQEGAYLDLTNEQIVVDTNTTAFSSSLASNRATKVRIEADFVAGETTFIITGGLSQEVVIAAHPLRFNNNCTITSNGGGEQLAIALGREVLIP